MSKINLPKLPNPLKEIAWFGKTPQDVYGRAEMIAYAEQAVREALAAQKPRAWLIRERKNGTDPMFTAATTTEPFESVYWPLAIIPENSDGDTP